MSGCRALSETEITNVINQLTSNRDKALFIIGLKTGFRISEILSLKISDVSLNGQVLSRVKVQKRNMKGQLKSREVPLHTDAAQAIMAYLPDLSQLQPQAPLFPSRNGAKAFKKPMVRQQAHKILTEAFRLAGIVGATGTHCMRKSFARKVYAGLKHDIIATQQALGHADLSSTVKYLAPSQDTIDAAILAA